MQPLGAGRFRLGIAGANLTRLGRPLNPGSLSFRPLTSAGAPALRVETVAPPTPSAPGQWSVVVAVDLSAGPRLPSLVYEVRVGATAILRARLERLAAPVSAPAFAEATRGIDYEARDYAALRTRLLGRIEDRVGPSFVANPVAQTVAVVEELAYLGDALSYAQDALATEAHLSSARRRISVTRAAALLDYQVDQGANARVWVEVCTDGSDRVVLPAGTQLLTRVPGFAPRVASDEVPAALRAGAEVFETMHEVVLESSRPGFRLDEVSHPEGRLDAGATLAIVIGAAGALSAGMLVVIEPRSGRDADGPAFVVRLTEVQPDGPGRSDLTLVRWADDDALAERVSRARQPYWVRLANLVLADHGRSVPGGPPLAPGRPPGEARSAFASAGPDHALAALALCRWPELERPRPRERYWPLLALQEVTFAAPPPASDTPAASSLESLARTTSAQVALREEAGFDLWWWSPRASLLASGPFARDFVVEVDNDGSARLRFGDGTNGRRPSPESRFFVRQRVGGGVAGNVGAFTIAHVVSDDPRVTRCANPVAARGGRDRELLSSIRINAPDAFRQNRRGVTDEDLAMLAREIPGVGDVAVVRSFTGTFCVRVVHILSEEGPDASPGLVPAVAAQLEPVAMLGEVVEVRPAVALPIEVVVEVATALGADPGFVGEQIDAAVRRKFLGAHARSLGQPLYRSEIVATFATVAGVVDAQVVVLASTPHRYDATLDAIRPRPGEVVHAEDDPSDPGRGRVLYRLVGVR